MKFQKILPFISCLIITIAIVIALFNKNKINDYRQRSVAYEVTIELKDKNDLKQLDAISYNLEKKTYQKVYNQILNGKEGFYKLKVRMPPEELWKLKNLLKKSTSIENFNIK